MGSLAAKAVAFLVCFLAENVLSQPNNAPRKRGPKQKPEPKRLVDYCAEEVETYCKGQKAYGAYAVLYCLESSKGQLSDRCRDFIGTSTIGGCNDEALKLCGDKVKTNDIIDCLKANKKSLGQKCLTNLNNEKKNNNAMSYIQDQSKHITTAITSLSVAYLLIPLLVAIWAVYKTRMLSKEQAEVLTNLTDPIAGNDQQEGDFDDSSEEGEEEDDEKGGYSTDGGDSLNMRSNGASRVRDYDHKPQTDALPLEQGPPRKYADENSSSGDLIRNRHRHCPWRISFYRVCYRAVISGDWSERLSRKPVTKKPILREVSGQFDPASVTAIMGPSGSGKTTLLKLLAGQTQHGEFSGVRMINGEALPCGCYDARMRRQGYVAQRDTLLEALTVWDTMVFAAMLRIDDKVPMRGKLIRAARVMQEMGLESAANTVVGSASMGGDTGGDAGGLGVANTGGGGGISGGQRRRLSIAIELLGKPRALLLDEPTSGLDSSSSLQVVQLLRRCSRQLQSTIVLTVHQPRAEVFGLFDSLVLLTEGGMVAYSGPTIHAAQFLAAAPPVTLNLDNYDNPGDFILDVLGLGDDGKETGEQSMRSSSRVSANRRSTSSSSGSSARGRLRTVVTTIRNAVVRSSVPAPPSGADNGKTGSGSQARVPSTTNGIEMIDMNRVSGESSQGHLGHHQDHEDDDDDGEIEAQQRVSLLSATDTDSVPPPTSPALPSLLYRIEEEVDSASDTHYITDARTTSRKRTSISSSSEKARAAATATMVSALCAHFSQSAEYSLLINRIKESVLSAIETTRRKRERSAFPGDDDPYSANIPDEVDSRQSASASAVGGYTDAETSSAVSALAPLDPHTTAAAAANNSTSRSRDRDSSDGHGGRERGRERGGGGLLGLLSGSSPYLHSNSASSGYSTLPTEDDHSEEHSHHHCINEDGEEEQAVGISNGADHTDLRNRRQSHVGLTLTTSSGSSSSRNDHKQPSLSSGTEEGYEAENDLKVAPTAQISQLWILFARRSQVFLSNSKDMVASVFQILLVIGGVLIAFSYQTDTQLEGPYQAFMIIFMASTYAMILQYLILIPEYMTERPVLRAERSSGLIDLTPYIGSAMLTEVPRALLQSSIIVGFIYSAHTLNPDTVNMTFCLVCLSVGVCAWQSLICVCAVVSDSISVAYTLSFLMLGSGTLFGGLLVRLQKIPIVFRVLYYISVAAVTQRALLVNDMKCCYLTASCNSISLELKEDSQKRRGGGGGGGMDPGPPGSGDDDRGGPPPPPPFLRRRRLSGRPVPSTKSTSVHEEISAILGINRGAMLAVRVLDGGSSSGSGSPSEDDPNRPIDPDKNTDDDPGGPFIDLIANYTSDANTFCPPGLQFTGDGSDDGNLGRLYLRMLGLQDDNPFSSLLLLFLANVMFRILAMVILSSRERSRYQLREVYGDGREWKEEQGDADGTTPSTGRSRSETITTATYAAATLIRDYCRRLLLSVKECIWGKERGDRERVIQRRAHLDAADRTAGSSGGDINAAAAVVEAADMFGLSGSGAASYADMLFDMKIVTRAPDTAAAAVRASS